MPPLTKFLDQSGAPVALGDTVRVQIGVGEFSIGNVQLLLASTDSANQSKKYPEAVIRFSNGSRTTVPVRLTQKVAQG